jgi:hypothetical protein
MHDRISAKHYGVAPTGNGRRQSFRDVPLPRMRNTYMTAGSVPPEEIIRAVREHKPDILGLSGLLVKSAQQMVITAGDLTQAGIDVLVDLQGLTSGARPAILGYRAAPVQISYLGLPGTSGLPGVDWILADHYVMPPELEPYCTEKPIRLPHCYQVSDRQREVAPRPQRSTYGLPEDQFVFCSFNNNFKFTPEVFGAWMRILQQVPRSVLWLLADNDTARENMLRQADAAACVNQVKGGRVQPPPEDAPLAMHGEEVVAREGQLRVGEQRARRHGGRVQHVGGAGHQPGAARAPPHKEPRVLVPAIAAAL